MLINKNKIIKIFLVVLFGITCYFTVLYWFHKSNENIDINEISEYENVIKNLKDTLLIQKQEINLLYSENDSLLQIEPEIKIRYREKIKYIYLSTTDVNDLDSIIRANWR